MSSFEPHPSSDVEPNPYAPPRSDVGPDRSPDEIAAIPFTLGEVLSRTWQIYRDRLGSCIGLVVGCWGLNLAAQFVLSAAEQAAPHARNPDAFAAVVAVAGPIAVSLFQLWINIGQTIVMLAIAQGWEAPFNDVFTGGRYLFKVIFASLLFAVPTMGLVALGVLPGWLILEQVGRGRPDGWVAIAIGLIVTVPVATVLALRMSQFYYLIIDRDAGAFDSLRMSSQITRGNAWRIFAIGALTVAILFVSVMFCGVAVSLLAGALSITLNLNPASIIPPAVGVALMVVLIATMPFIALLFVVTYLSLTGQPTAGSSSKEDRGGDPEPF